MQDLQGSLQFLLHRKLRYRQVQSRQEKLLEFQSNLKKCNVVPDMGVPVGVAEVNADMFNVVLLEF